MKPRTVIVTLECMSDAPLLQLKRAHWVPQGYLGHTTKIRQVTVSVAQPVKAGKGKK